jgi:hypothetical protein
MLIGETAGPKMNLKRAYAKYLSGLSARGKISHLKKLCRDCYALFLRSSIKDESAEASAYSACCDFMPGTARVEFLHCVQLAYVHNNNNPVCVARA